MSRLVFTVYGSPVAQGRPRFARIGGFVRTYDPSKSKNWKQDVKAQVLQQLGGAPPALLEGPLELQVVFHLPRPKSLPKRVTHHVKKPDCTNLVKGIEDALNGILWRDDSQLVDVSLRKVYGDPPRVVIGIREVAGA
jgi:Holliday junction resolvase RusA-like endonuclease